MTQTLYTAELVLATDPPRVRRGYIYSQGRKVLIQIREGKTANYATLRKDGGLDGEHLTEAESYLKTRQGRGVLSRLLEGKTVPI